MRQTQSIFQKEVHPYYQVAIAVGLNLVGLLIIKLGMAEEASADDKVIYWEYSFSILLAFMLFNSVFSIPYKNRTQYFRDSIFSFMALAGFGGIVAYFFSGMSMDEAGSFRWLYFVFTFTYLVFISIVNLMRKIIEIAFSQDDLLADGYVLIENGKKNKFLLRFS